MKDRPNERSLTDGGRGTNILLMGVDSRAGVSDQEKQEFHAGGAACHCTDVLMLVHVSASRDRVSVVGLPRDSYALIPAHPDRVTGQPVPSRPGKINAAFAQGGAPLSVRTVEDMTHIRIDHYLQLDFRRFIDAVDLVGGVEVCTTYRLKDSATKLDLAPGRHLLSGGGALQYVRSRHVDAGADFGRIQRQQRFLVAGLRKLAEHTTLFRPFALPRLARTVLGATETDQGLSLPELTTLIWRLRELPPSATEFMTVPISGFRPPADGIGSTIVWDRAEAGAVFADLAADRPLTSADPDAHFPDPPRMGNSTPVRGNTLACS
jgi:LCP family protein required for cell wall assembly